MPLENIALQSIVSFCSTQDVHLFSIYICRSMPGFQTDTILASSFISFYIYSNKLSHFRYPLPQCQSLFHFSI
ncbi:hypothetical protein BLOT_014209 [Blomia tropicalis]|nr:hypothetical protein BLOT_014209 [Blomia tropicalis]